MLMAIDKEKLADAGIDTIGTIAGLCSGAVLNAGLSAIAPPAAKPIMKYGFKAGKWLISAAVTALVNQYTTDSLRDGVETIGSIKNALVAAKAKKEEKEE